MTKATSVLLGKKSDISIKLFELIVPKFVGFLDQDAEFEDFRKFF